MARHVQRATVYSCNDVRLKSIPRREAEEMVESGAARRLSRPKAERLVIQLFERRTSERELLANSTITVGEMEANAFGAAGMAKRRRGGWSERRKQFMPANFVDRAMTKIEIWPFIGDDLAVRVGPRV